MDPRSQPEEEQKRAGYYHTLREILQQPDTWRKTCEDMLGWGPRIEEALTDAASLTLTGSGSSAYAGECVALGLQRDLGIDAQAIPAGTLLTEGSGILPRGRPGVLVSLSRSGGSPESAALVARLLESEPAMRHLVLTCNPSGALARAFDGDERVRVVVLDDRTNDRSLVMTSSVTNLALAARFLGMRNHPQRWRRLCASLGDVTARLFGRYFEVLAELGRRPFRRVVYLGSGSRFGAARECALKMLEMTAGRVAVMAETCLGLRHGPITFVDQDTLVVCFLSAAPVMRAYERDLIGELDRKGLGSAKLLAGSGISAELAQRNGTLLELAGLGDGDGESTPLAEVAIGQMLAFFRCRAEGFKPDSPSESGVISRVVGEFTLHR